jgi:hypothetical protein
LREVVKRVSLTILFSVIAGTAIAMFAEYAFTSAEKLGFRVLIAGYVGSALLGWWVFRNSE